MYICTVRDLFTYYNKIRASYITVHGLSQQVCWIYLIIYVLRTFFYATLLCICIYLKGTLPQQPAEESISMSATRKMNTGISLSNPLKIFPAQRTAKQCTRNYLSKPLNNLSIAETYCTAQYICLPTCSSEKSAKPANLSVASPDTVL
jgi:hypothetical protein